ncbi:hypothetical protein J27TS8_28150 [Robertmurraya siralis]|uniref:Uncharacterized protein n=1 Tax=Robertmurraya siralis TaxID=77777 RepID=A0A919WJF4_9BACI|nr:hypothetical protein CHH80_22370 [Bacillus sp. 7504-2]GIN62822.1 hypothetical protein J27TS8_28150 [Robertmurraya siralis]
MTESQVGNDSELNAQFDGDSEVKGERGSNKQLCTKCGRHGRGRGQIRCIIEGKPISNLFDLIKKNG